MKERPILFSAPMVRALRAGTKTQTRRVVKDRHIDAAPPACFFQWLRERCPYGQTGDRLWVRETWQHSNFPLGPYDESCTVFYRADYMDDPHGPDGEKSPEGRYRNWEPSIHMFRSASRILLEVTAVRVERLQDISAADAVAEGIARDGDGYERFHVDPDAPVGQSFTRNPVLAYRGLWESINGVGAWDKNPWVWVIEFKRVEGGAS
ncbi:Phage-related protein [Thauera humireducens]|jgi:hypothetical protein|uniref:hypothetical protein n=1 Tax=Thauera humireducens TaxID=1134435 RepID=UPI002467A953|nr:hypothetical protein [Thauera humireducens]CAH1747875.1 Phage-related protein [Thauera humireducens]